MNNKSHCPNCNRKLFLFFLKKRCICPDCGAKLLTNINTISIILILFMAIMIGVTQLFLMTTSRVLFTILALMIFYLSKLIGDRLVKINQNQSQ